MINRLKLFINNEKLLFNENKIKYVFSTIILISIGLLLFMLPGLSYTSLHKIPLLFAGFLAIIIFVYLIMYQKIFIDKYIIMMLLFCLSVLISSLLNDPKQIEQTVFLLTGIFIMLYEFISSNENKTKAIYAIYVGLCFFALYFFISYFKEIISLDIGRLGSMFGNENAISNYFCFGYIINLHLFLNKKNYPLVITLPFFALFGALTGSKLFLIMLVLVTIAFIIMFFGKKRWYWSLAIVVIGFGVVISLLQLPMFETLNRRFLTMIKSILGDEGYIDMSTITRYNMFFEGIYLFTYKPIFGWGLNGFMLNGPYHTYSHSAVSETLCNFGVIGFTCFFAPIFINAFSNHNKEDKKIQVMILIFMICVSIFGMSYTSKIYYVALATMCACSNNYPIIDDDKKWLYYKK